MADDLVGTLKRKLSGSRYGPYIIFLRSHLARLLSNAWVEPIAIKLLAITPGAIGVLIATTIRSQKTSPESLNKFRSTLMKIVANRPNTASILSKGFKDFRFFDDAAQLDVVAGYRDDALKTRLSYLIQSGSVDEAAAILKTHADKLSRETQYTVTLELLESLAKYKEIVTHLIGTKSPAAFVAEASVQTIQKTQKAMQYCGEYKQAKHLLATACNAHDDIILKVSKANLHFDLLEIDACRRIIKNLHSSQQQNSASLELAGDLALFEGRGNDAAESYFESLKNDLPIDFSASVFRKLLNCTETGEDSLANQFISLIGQQRPHTSYTRVMEARAHLESDHIDQHIAFCQKALKLDPKTPTALHWYAHGVAWETSLDDDATIASIISIYESAIQVAASHPWWIISDYLRTLARFGKWEKCSEIVSKFRKLIELPSIAPNMFSSMSLYEASQGNLSAVYKQSCYSKPHRILSVQQGAFRIHETFENLQSDCPCLFLSEGGVGDEIRLSRFYGQILKQFPNAHFTADQRLYGILARAYGEERIIPTERLYGTQLGTHNLSRFNDLPHRILTHYFDNASFQYAVRAGHVMTVKCAVSCLLDGTELTPIKGHLNADAEAMNRVTHNIAATLPRPWVGISWRSANQQYRRAEHYFSLEEISSFAQKLDGTLFNINYFADETELEEIERRSGKQIINFETIDMKDDFESQFAIMEIMDVVVGVNNAVVESAGAINSPTLFCVFGRENDWRQQDSGHDRYFESIKIIKLGLNSSRMSSIERLREEISCEHEKRNAC